MSNKFFLHKKRFVVVFILGLFSYNITAQNFLENRKKIEIHYAIQVQKLMPNYKDGTFYAEFYWWMRFFNDSTKTGYKFHEVLNIQYVNSTGNSVNSFQKGIQEIKKRTDSSYYLSGLHQGTFLFYPNYKKYPFDVQELTIMVDNAVIPSEDLEFILDTASYINSLQDRNFWGISHELINTESKVFNIKSSHSIVYDGIYNTDFGDIDFPPISKFSRFKKSIFIERPIVPFITKSTIPLLFILCLTYMIFFLDADKLDSSRGLAVTSMFSSFAFQMTSTKDLPDVGYVIYVDKVFYIVYFLIATSIVVTIIRYNLHLKDSEKNAPLIQKINLLARIFFPIIFFGGAYLLADF